MTDVNGTGHRYLTLVLALVCMSAVGMTATTLKSSLTTDPDDVIDFEYSYLPFGKEDVREVKLESRANAAGGGASDSADQQSTTHGLLGLLWKLLAALLALVALAVAYRHRERFLAAVRAGGGWVADRTPERPASGRPSWPSSEPADDLQRAWLAMVERANPDRPWTRTPAEVARAAVEAGIDSETVGRLTSHFEAVRYGNAPLTEERRRQARQWLERIDRSGGRDR